MAARLAFQTQLASIMEVLANAAVAEICKLVDDDYAVVSLQMSQCQRENKVLKRKLHLLELKMARGYAERRLRESVQSAGRPRVQINASERLRGSAASSDGVFQRQMDLGLWSGGAATGETTSQPVHTDPIQDNKAPDVELVEPEPRLVKEEKMEENLPPEEELEEDVPLIGEDGAVECGPRGGGGRRTGLQQQQDTQLASCQTQIQTPAHLPQTQLQVQVQSQTSRTRHPGSGGGSNNNGGNNNRGVEAAAVQKQEEPDVVLVKVEEAEPAPGTQSQTGLSIQEGLVESSTDDYRGAMPFEETTQNSTHQPIMDLQESGRGFSESPAPESVPLVTEEPCSIVSVQLRVPDTNTPANPHQQPPRSNTGTALSSEYSLFELETFFTRWAPDSGAASPPRGPSCSFSTDDSAKCGQDGVLPETVPQPQLMLQPPQGSTSVVRLSGGEGGESFSSLSGRPRAQPAVPQGTSAAVPLQLQPPSSQPLWSRTAAMMRTAQTQSLLQQQRRYGNRISQQPHGIHPPQNKLSTAAAGGVSSVSSIRSTCRTMGSTMVPGLSLAARGTASPVAAGRRWPVSLLAHQNKSQAADAGSLERRRKSYLCRACGKAFSGLSNLEAHQRVHTGEKPFRCTTCGKQFSEAGNLKKHQRVHTGEKPYSCDQCGKRFAWICNLKTHQQSATGCGLLGRGGGGAAGPNQGP